MPSHPVLDGGRSDARINRSVDPTLQLQQLEPNMKIPAEGLQCHDDIHKHTPLELGLATKPPAQIDATCNNLNNVRTSLPIQDSVVAASAKLATSQVSIVIQPPPTCTVNVGPKTFEIEAVNLCYRPPPQHLTVPINVGALMCKGGNSNVTPLAQDCSSNLSGLILKNVNCKAKAGEVLAIAGPSGAGKSTLLELLAGMIKPTSPPESIMVNQQPMIGSSFRRISGYIPQHDALFPLLTVRETLLFSANLRLPPTMSTQDKKQRVSSLMAELGLQHVADTRVGNETIRGLSGGERRRVSIGVDVIHDPCVLLLDEPTSGLDSASALNVVEMLHSMAKTRSRTIILTIHQPGYRIMQQISSFLLLAKGCVIHHGSLKMLEMRLIEAGHKIPAQVNVLEYAIDEISYGTDFHLLKGEDDDGPNMLAEADGVSLHKKSNINKVIGSPLYGNHVKGDMEQVVGCPCTIAVEMQIQESGSVLMMQVANKSAAATSATNVEGDSKIDKPGFANHSSNEVIVLSQRFARNIFRTHELFTARTAQAIVAGLALGSVYMHVGNNPRGVADRLGFFAFTLTFLFSSTVEALPIFLQERHVLLRETSRGAYRMSSYLIANFLVFLPFLLFLAVLYAVPVYYLIGLSKDGSAFLFFVLVVWMVLLTANSFVAFLGALVPDYIMGNSVISGCMGAFFLFSGYFITKQEMPFYWRFMHYISLFKYPLDALLINEYRSLGNTCLGFELGGGECGLTGDVVLQELGLGNSSKWLDVAIMLTFICSYRLLGYLVLRSKMCRRRR